MNQLALRCRRATWLLLSALFLAVAVPRPASGCASSEPPPPACGKTLALAKAVPGVVLLPGGGIFNVPSVLFFDLVDFPPGAGICPAGPYSATVSLTATCTPGPGGSGMVTVPIVPGFNSLTVPVTVGAGPARRCAIAGTATVALADGTALSALGDSVACVAEAAPGNPAVPRLDMEIVGPAGSEIVRVHPGDQATFRVRVTNNDPSESFSGVLDGELVSSARLPGISGAMPTGTGPFSISDPVEGDNFPIGLAEDLVDGCLPLPRDPTDPAVPDLHRQIDLDPGESIEIEVYARPWGMCANGSCGEGTLVLEGGFSDVTPGLACAGFGVAVDTSVAPGYQWPDAGQSAQVLNVPAPANFVTLAGSPTPTSDIVIDFETTQATLRVGGLATSTFTDFFSAALTPDRGRTRIRFVDPIGLDSFGSYELQMEIEAEVTQGILLLGSEPRLIPEAPTGFADFAPVGEGLFKVLQPSGSQVVGYLDLMYQVNAIGIDEVGERRDITFGSVEMVPNSDGNGFVVVLSEGVVAPGPGVVLFEVEVNQDFQGFTSEVPQNPVEIFSDGFESGDVASWTFVVR